MITNQNNDSTYRHTHDGINSEKVFIKDLVLTTPPIALTAADNGAISTGGSNDLKTTDNAVITNMRLRISEIEARLRELGLIL